MDHMAEAVGQDLKLNVFGVKDELLHIELPISKAGQRLSPGLLEFVLHVLLAVHPAHAPAAASGAGLHQHRVADFLSHLHGLLGRLYRSVGAGDHGDMVLLHQLPGGRLVAHHPDHISRGANEAQAQLGALVGKFRAF